MRFKIKLVFMVSAALMIIGLTSIFTIPALSKEGDVSRNTFASPTNSEFELYERLSNRLEQGLPLTPAEKKQHIELASRYGSRLRETPDLPSRDRHTLDEYIWTTATYDWVDISGIGTNTGITGDDQNLGPFTLGFSFPFYGTSYTSIRVCSNGFLSFTSTSTIYTNTAIPATAEPNNVLYPFWDDMYPLDGGQILYYADAANQRFIVTWNGIQHIDGTEPYTYQAILYPGGNIVYQYHTIPVSSPGNTSCTVGIENATGTQAVQVCFNGAGSLPTSGMAILIGQPDGVPNPCTNLTGTYIAPNVVLNWTDPTHDTNGNLIGIDNVEVWLGAAGTGQLLATVGAGAQTYTHENAPVGNLTYTIRPFLNPYYGAATSIPMVVGTPGYTNNFDTNNGQWVATPATGGWEWGIPWGISGLIPHSTPNVWGTVVAGNYAINACWQLDLNIGLVVTSAAATVEFWHWFYSATTYDGCNFKVSVDNGATWTVLTPTQGGYSLTSLGATSCMTGQPAWAGLTPHAWQYCVIPIGQYVGQVPIFRFEFASDAITSAYPGFYFDDFTIWGVSGQQAGIPTPCTNFAANYSAPNVVMTWTDPLLDTQGNPLLIDSVQVWFGSAGSGTFLGAVVGGSQTFTHLNAPIGIQTYSIRPRHENFFGPPVSTTVTVGSPGYISDFEANNGDWAPDPAVGGWEWGTPSVPATLIPHSGSNLWGTVLNANYPANACFKLQLNRDLAVVSPTATIEFWRWWDTEATYDGCHFEASTNGGATWEAVQPTGGYGSTSAATTACIPSQPVWSGHTGGIWTYVVIPIGQYLGQVPKFRFVFGTNATTFYPGFFFDDMVIWGANPQNGVPAPVTNFTGQYVSPNAVLSWTDPTQDTYGIPVIVDSVQVCLGSAGIGTRLGSVGPGIQTFTHLNAPIGIQTYTLRAFNESFGGAPTSTQVTVGTPGYVNTFETNDGNWVPTPETGGWSWGTPTNTSAPAPYSGASYWGTGLFANYPNDACWQVDLDEDLVVTSPTATVEFWYRFGSESTYDGCNFKASVDDGATWTVLPPSEGAYNVAAANAANTCMAGQPIWSGTAQTAWQHAVIPIGQLVGQIPIFRFEFGADPIVSGYMGFFFDDMIIWGAGQQAGVPRPCTSLSGSYVAPNVVLTWTDPTLDTQGNPVTIDSVQIWVGSTATGTHIGTVIGGAQTFTHANAPSGNYFYTVRPYHAPYFGSPTSTTTIIVGNPSFANDFELNNGGWVADPPAAGWEWGTPTLPATLVSHSGTKVWGTVLAGNYIDNACYLLTFAPGMIIQSPTATVEFWYWYDTEPTWDGCTFQVSVDGGTTWDVGRPLTGYPDSMIVSTSRPCNGGLPAWGNHSGSHWAYAVIPIGQWVGMTPMFRFRFGSDNISAVFPGFFFDDMTIWGLRPPSAITGVVRSFGNNQPIANARIWAAGQPDTVTSDSTGTYLLPLEAGTYAVTFDHLHYCDTTYADIVVETGLETTRHAILRAPQAQISRTSITMVTWLDVDTTDTMRISNNSGQCPLDFSISDTSEWLSVEPASGTVNPNQSVVVTISAEAPDVVDDFSADLIVTYNAVGTPRTIRVDLSVADAADDPNWIPTEFAYRQNYPNPFNAQTALRFDVPQQSRVRITIYNIMGQEVARAVDHVYAPGRYRVLYDARALPSGMYLVKMSAADYSKIGKMLLLK